MTPIGEGAVDLVPTKAWADQRDSDNSEQNSEHLGEGTVDEEEMVGGEEVEDERLQFQAAGLNLKAVLPKDSYIEQTVEAVTKRDEEQSTIVDKTAQIALKNLAMQKLQEEIAELSKKQEALLEEKTLHEKAFLEAKTLHE